MKDYSRIIKKLNQFFEENPEELGEKNTSEDIQHIESTLNVRLNEFYKAIISNFGSCYLGLPIYSLRISEDLGNETVIELTHWFRELASKHLKTDEYQNLIAFSHDGAGNYILINDESNDLFIYYHEEGEIESFEDEKLDQFVMDYASA